MADKYDDNGDSSNDGAVVTATCQQNAEHLLCAAEVTAAEGPTLNHIAYHLCLLALEEVGKGELAIARQLDKTLDRDTTYLDKRVDDHVFKIFWALWTPYFATSGTTKDGLESFEAMATKLHARRLETLYSMAEPGQAADKISGDELQTLRVISRSRLEMSKARDWKSVSPNDPNMIWLVESVDDPTKRPLIFGNKAILKLHELQNVHTWVEWLKAQFTTAATEAAEAFALEKARVVPAEPMVGAAKWRSTTRIFSPSHSVRANALSAWNDHSKMVQFKAVTGNKFALDLELTLQESVGLESLSQQIIGFSNMALAALNISSNGFWWWSEIRDNSRFATRIDDLEHSKFVDARVNAAEVKWQQNAMKTETWKQFAICFSGLGMWGQPLKSGILQPYLAGITFLGKTDSRFSFASPACERFSDCLLAALKHFQQWDGLEHTFKDSLAACFPNSDIEDSLLEETRNIFLTARKPPTPEYRPTASLAFGMKGWCDLLLMQQLHREFVAFAKSHTSAAPVAANAVPIPPNSPAPR